MINDVLCTGHASWDISMAVTHHPASDEKITAHAMQLSGGGPAANAAVCIARLGGHAAFCGYLGHDLFGQAHLQELQQAGVDTTTVVRGDHPTPVSQILAKQDGLRSVVNFKGDTPTLAVDTAVPDRLPAVLLFDGHEPDLSLQLCEQARLQQCKTVLDAGSLHRGTQLLAPRVDYLVASARFASQYARTDDMMQALNCLAGTGNTAIITLGEEGLIWSRDGVFGSLPAFNITAIDSTGAGDAFHGAFALGVAREMPWSELLRYASAAGALTCTRLGARTALPDAAAVASLLAAQTS
ncbi:carbohydrate kinase family protein [Mariprofundus erugo]|uniref:carbohydrate kinase family protein n=1 Tax=Mariprofundus erugo TaxID=2528639 RepID=UPI00159C84F4|nr:PfkB family carbohydrate kinase [Mariprofundus erugo]